MASNRFYKTEGVVLQSSPFQESGLLVTIFTLEHGKIRAVAPGARRSRSKMVGHLEPLTKTELILTRSRSGNMDTITQAQAKNAFRMLKSNLDAISHGLYVGELVKEFGSEANPNKPLYNLMIDTLSLLSENYPAHLILRYFELHLLRTSGFMPELFKCVECREQLLPGKHFFCPIAGGTLCQYCRPRNVQIINLSLSTLKVLRFIYRTTSQQFLKLHLDKSVLSELKNLLSLTIKLWLEKEIRSNKFIDHLELNSRNTVCVENL